jgi:hypothetical protein
VFSAEWRDITAPGAVIKVTKQGRRYNAMAGFARNQKMADYAEALVAVWDGRSSGTRDMLDRARARGLKVFVHIGTQPCSIITTEATARAGCSYIMSGIDVTALPLKTLKIKREKENDQQR